MYEAKYIPPLSPLINETAGILCRGKHDRSFIKRGDPSLDTAHVHNYCEIYVHVQGDGAFLVEQSLYPLLPGDVILTKPNEIHHLVYHGDEVYEYYCVWISAEERLGFFPEFLWEHENGKGNLIRPGEEERERLFSCLASFCQEEGKEQKRDAGALSGFFGLISLMEQCRSNEPGDQPMPEVLQRILNYIETHYHEACKVEEIARSFFISRSSLYALFKRHLNLTPSAYVEAKRFSLAKKLLLAGRSVQQVCDACGFCDCSYFIAQFRRRFGITPYRYGKEHRK